MSIYKSKHTGAQVDEAVSKVLNGDIEGSNIKESSIPLSALATEVKDKIENAGGGADWNAQKGEPGYIQNRTHSIDLIEVLNVQTKHQYNINVSDYVDLDFFINGQHEVRIDVQDNNFEMELSTYTNSYGTHPVFSGTIDKGVLSFDIDDWDDVDPIVQIIGRKFIKLSEDYIPDTIARKSDIPVPIIINYNTIKDAANSEVNTISEQTWLKYIANDTYKNYDWIIQRDGIKYNCTVIPDYDNRHIQILYFTRNEIEGTSGPLGNAIMKYSGLRIKLLPYTENTYLIYKISNGGSLETREFVFGENYNNNAYLIAAAQMSGIDTIDCKWVYTTKADETITVNGQYFHIENSITNVDAIFSVKDKSLTYVDGNGLINKVTFADNGSYAIIPDTVVKTTPQTLSDADKNQALANLGIDPVVWKYMCNPITIYDGYTIPEEIAKEILTSDGKFKYKVPGMYRIHVSSFGDLQEDSHIYYQFTPTDVRDNLMIYVLNDVSDYIQAKLRNGVWSVYYAV